MTTLHICRGLPGSGKSTYAKEWVAADPGWRARVNRGDVRNAVHPAYVGAETEKATTIVSHAAIGALLRNGWAVIVDDTNLNPAHVRRLLDIAYNSGADVAWHDFEMHPHAAKLAQQDRPESERVADEVIDRFAEFLVDGHLPVRPIRLPRGPRR